MTLILISKYLEVPKTHTADYCVLQWGIDMLPHHVPDQGLPPGLEKKVMSC